VNDPPVMVPTDAPATRQVQSPSEGRLVAFPEVADYIIDERRAA